ncbi:MAG: protein phosphatase 2C domain-containing protein [Kofleriaceae bacterium]|nr:protein phosphatase 2C domain-containing protein [Kofleriaceae bacterium]
MSAIVAAAVTDVGKVREHNEDSHFIDAEAGVFIVCDGMGGHAAGEVASTIAVKEVRARWRSDAVEDMISIWLHKPSPESRLAVLGALQTAVTDAHLAIVAEARRDLQKRGMGTTIVAVRVIGGDAFFAHAGDSRGYLVRDGIAMQVTEDHTLLARLLAAGIDVDTTGDGARFRSMLTNALGIGDECRVSTFVLPLADGDRFLLCSDGISEYLPEKEIGEVLTLQASPARAAQKLVDLALERGGADNATAVVVRVLEAGESASSAAMRSADAAAIASCPWLSDLTPQQRLRATKIAISRDFAEHDSLPALALNDRVAWLLLEGTVVSDGEVFGRGALVYSAMLTEDPPLVTRTELAVVTREVRALAFRADDFFELCLEDPELAELLRTRLDDLLTLQASRDHARAGTVLSEVTDPPSDAVNEFVTEEVSLGGTVPIKRAPTELERDIAVAAEQAAKTTPGDGHADGDIDDDPDGEVTQLGALPKPPVPDSQEST